MENIRETIAKKQRLKELRKSAVPKPTQEDLADFLDVSVRQYREYEKGKVLPPIEHCVRLSDFYGVSIEYLLGLDDCKHPNNKYITDFTGPSEDSINILWSARNTRVKTDFKHGFIVTIENPSFIDADELQMLNDLITGNGGNRLLRALHRFIYFDSPVLITAMGENEGLRAPTNKRHYLSVTDNHCRELEIKVEDLNEVNKLSVMTKLQQLKEELNLREEALKNGNH